MSMYRMLLDEQAKLKGEWDGIIKQAEAESRTDLSAEEATRRDQIRTRLGAVGEGLKAEEDRRAWERTVPAADAPRITQVYDRAGEAPWGSLGDQLQAVIRAGMPGERVDPRLYAAASGASTGVPSDAGFLVRQDYSTALLNRAIEQAVLAPLCTPITIGADSDGIDMPMVNETSRANGSRWGGVQVYWRREAATVTATKPELEMKDLRLQELMGLAYLTDRTVKDARALQSIFEIAFSSEMAFKLDDAIFRGNGSGLPLGITNSAGPRVSTTKETGQAADTIVHANISNMWKNVDSRSKARGVWLYNGECGPQFDQLVLTAGAGAVEQRVVTYNEAGMLRIKGRPALEIEQASALGDEGDLVYADFSQYVLIRKGGLEQAESMHVRFIYGENTLRWIYRVNGSPMWSSALTPYKGSGTRSPFVTLAARA